MKTTVFAPDAPAALGPYSHAVLWNGLVFTSGQIGVHPASGKLASTVGEQTRQALHNIRAVLAAAGCTLSDVVKTTVFVQDLGDFATINAIYGEIFSGEFPARSCTQVAKLPAGALVEIEAIVVKS